MNRSRSFLLLLFCLLVSSRPMFGDEDKTRGLQILDPIAKRPSDSPKLTVDQELVGWYQCAGQEIDKHWMIPKSAIPANYACSCSFMLNGNGTISNLKLLSSEGSDKLDKSLLDAVENAFPLQQKFERAVNELASHRKFKMEFNESEYPKYRFKAID